MWSAHWKDKSRSIHLKRQRNWSKQGIASTTGIIQGSNTTVHRKSLSKGNGGIDTLAGACVDPTKGVRYSRLTFNFNPDKLQHRNLIRSKRQRSNYKINDQLEPYAEVFIPRVMPTYNSLQQVHFHKHLTYQSEIPLFLKRCAIKFLLVEASPLRTAFLVTQR